MKVIKLNGLKPEIKELDYNILKEEKENYEKKGKIEKVKSYAKLLDNLSEKSTSTKIEKEVNKIIDDDLEKLAELKKEVKRLVREINLLSKVSERETKKELDDVSSIISSL